jgi:cytochrome P450
MAAFQPLSVGRQACLGMRHAYAEIRVTLTQLLWSFDIVLKDEGDLWDWGEQKTYIFWVSGIILMNIRLFAN